jgi:hypothetical protein
MGIDALCIATQLPKGRFFRLSGRKALAAIEASAKKWAAQQNLGPLLQTDWRGDRGLTINLIPVADPIFFDINKSGLAVGFRSSNGGPGFHAAVVDLLDHLAVTLSLEWVWADSSGAPLDETDYARTRDFAALQGEMTAFFKLLTRDTATAGEAVGSPGIYRNFCLPLELGRIPDQTCCPLGFMEHRWGEKMAQANAAALHSASQQFFIWWDKGLTPATWQNLLRAQLWQNAEWRRQHSAHDRLVRQKIEHCAAQLKRLDTPLPADLAEAYAEYQYYQSSDDAPKPTGIGYRKRLIWEQIYESWSIGRPGYLQVSENSGSAAWEHPAYWLGAKSFFVTEAAVDKPPFEYPPGFTNLEFEIRPGLKCRKTNCDTVGDNGKLQSALLVFEMGDTRHLLLLTLSSHLDWPFNEFDTWINSVVFNDKSAAQPVSKLN